MTKILIIEDNPTNMQLMVYLLQAFGHTPLEAVTGELGLVMARHQTPNLILCDLQLPGMDGYEIARQVKADPKLNTIPLIAVTAYAMVGDRDKVMAARFDGYIAKPIIPETFVEQIEAFLPPDQRPGQLRPSTPEN
jgi:CheY-like chemotaxis protein